MQQEALRRDALIVYNNQQQLTGHCSFPPRNNGNQGQHAIIVLLGQDI